MEQLFQTTTTSSTSPIDMIRTPSTSSPTSPLSLSLDNAIDNNCTNDTNNLPLIDNYANQLLLHNESNGNSSTDSQIASHSGAIHSQAIAENGIITDLDIKNNTKLFAEMEDLDDAQTFSASDEQPRATATTITTNTDDGSDSYDDVDHTAMRKKKLSLTLPLLNVVITDPSGSNAVNSPSPEPSAAAVTAEADEAMAADIERQPSPTNSKTKKFYESDDTFIQTIFSQTIASTTATPTDDFANYPFEDYNTGSVEQTPTVDQLVAPISSQQPESLNDDTQTEKLDTYKETLISFSDIVDMDNECKDGLDSDNEDQYNRIYENLNSEEQAGDEAEDIIAGTALAIDDAKTDTSTSLYENLDGCDNFDEAHADADDHIYDNVELVDGHGETYRLTGDLQQMQQTQNQPLSSYFDQTIEEDDSYNEEMIGATTPPHGMTNNDDLDDGPLPTTNQSNNTNAMQLLSSASPPLINDDHHHDADDERFAVSADRGAGVRLNGDDDDQQHSDSEASAHDNFDINVSPFVATLTFAPFLFIYYLFIITLYSYIVSERSASATKIVAVKSEFYQ